MAEEPTEEEFAAWVAAYDGVPAKPPRQRHWRPARERPGRKPPTDGGFIIVAEENALLHSRSLGHFVAVSRRANLGLGLPLGDAHQ